MPNSEAHPGRGFEFANEDHGGDPIKSLLWRVSIARILVVGFFLLVLVPICISGVSFTRQIYSYGRSKQIVSYKETVNLIAQEIENRVRQVEEIGWNITYNSIVIDFLQNDYASNASQGYEKYLHFVDFLENYNTYNRLASSVNERLFMVNETIPEGFGCFHRISRIENKQWFKDFLGDDANCVWIFADALDYYDHRTQSDVGQKESFIYLNKICNYKGDFLGILAIEVDVDHLLQQYDMEHLYILQERSSTLLREPDLSTLEHFGGSQNFIAELEKADVGKTASVIRRIEPLEIQVGVVNLPQSVNDLILLFGGDTVVIFAGVFLFSIIFGVLLHSCMGMLRKCIDSIEICIFENKLMEEPKRLDNEIGRIIHQFNGQCRKIRQMISDRIKLETAEKEIQLRYMRNIISPHFFYNTLDVISSSMILAGQEEIADAVANFSRMMRYAFKTDKTVTLESELNCIASFVNLQKTCYHERLELQIEVDDCLKTICCPKFILQPVVENSIRHGLRSGGEVLHIRLKTRIVDGEILELSVEDDGVGMTPERLEELTQSIEGSSEPEDAGFGIGLYTVNTQLKTHSGSSFTLKVRSERDVGTAVILPIRINGGG